MILEEKISIFFKFFNEKHTGIKQSFEVSDTEKKYVSKFIVKISDDIHISSIGFDWLWDYFCFQFSYWNDLTMGYSNSVQMSWVLGKKALDRWANRRDDSGFLNKMFSIEENISKTELKKLLDEDKNLSIDELFEIEETERKRFLNEKTGLVHCLDVTSLAHPESEACSKCIYASECKEVLRFIAPHLYRKRGYAKRKRIEF